MAVKRKKMTENTRLTLAEGCDLYLLHCRQRNLREAAIKHYRQSDMKPFTYFDPELPLRDMDESVYHGYVVYLCETLDNSVSINSYLRDLITTLHFLMRDGHMASFKMESIRVDQQPVETYSDAELQILLKKPNMKKCTYTEFQSWVMINFLFSTGVRQRSLIHIKIRDIDFDNRMVNIRVTKNRKNLIIPLNPTMIQILHTFLKYRQYQSQDDFLFTNVYGNQLCKSTCYYMLSSYNKQRKVTTTGIHRYRHTFAKQRILAGGNVVTLSKILGHSNLAITQNYINLLVSDVAKQVDEINMLERFSGRRQITMKR